MSVKIESNINDNLKNIYPLFSLDSITPFSDSSCCAQSRHFEFDITSITVTNSKSRSIFISTNFELTDEAFYKEGITIFKTEDQPKNQEWTLVKGKILKLALIKNNNIN